jgi:hypothetical protein
MGAVLERHHLIEASGHGKAEKLLPAETVRAFSPSDSEEADFAALMLKLPLARQYQASSDLVFNC